MMQPAFRIGPADHLAAVVNSVCTAATAPERAQPRHRAAAINEGTQARIPRRVGVADDLTAAVNAPCHAATAAQSAQVCKRASTIEEAMIRPVACGVR